MRPKLRNGARGGAGRQAGGVAQQPPRGEVAEVFPPGEAEGGRLDWLHRGEYPGDLLVESANRAEHQQFVRGLGENHPLAAAGMDEGSRLGEGGLNS